MPILMDVLKKKHCQEVVFLSNFQGWKVRKSYWTQSKKFLTHAIYKYVYNLVGVLFQILGQLEFPPTGRFLMQNV